jgi:enoyl-[acyl-carrier-protein] reductase (NADH)
MPRGYHQRLPAEEQVTAEEIRKRLAAGAPLHKTIAPEEVGDLIVFLASERSSSISCVSINIDTGLPRFRL